MINRREHVIQHLYLTGSRIDYLKGLIANERFSPVQLRKTFNIGKRAFPFWELISVIQGSEGNVKRE